jgi:glycosyltransferase involved in cell wall biosynthesis
MKTLLLGMARSAPERGRIGRLERADAHPRVLLFEDRLGGEWLECEYAKTAPLSKRILYRRLPEWVAQVFEVYARRRRYDAVVSWGEKQSLLFALLLTLSASRTRHVPLLYWISPPKKALLLRLVHSRIAHIVTWSSVQHEIAVHRLGIPASRITLTRHPVDHRFWRPFDTTTDMICAAGNEMRDYATLIQAMRGLDIACHIAVKEVASGTSRKVTRKGAILATSELPNNVTVGSKSYPELRALYARSRCVVVPLRETDTDNGVTSILEAMAMGKAVICSRVRGQVDVIEEGKTGIFVPQGDPQALAQAIQYLWERPELANQMGEAGRQRVEQRHTIDQFVETVGTVVENVIAEPGPAAVWDVPEARPQRNPGA